MEKWEIKKGSISQKINKQDKIIHVAKGEMVYLRFRSLFGGSIQFSLTIFLKSNLFSSYIRLRPKRIHIRNKCKV